APKALPISLVGDHAYEVGGIVRAAVTFPLRSLWIRTQRTPASRHAIVDFRGNDLLRRFSVLDPLLEGANRVEGVRTIAAGAMSHSGNQEEAEKIGDPVRSAHLDFDALVIFDGIRGGYVTIRPSVIHQQLSILRLEGSQIRIH